MKRLKACDVARRTVEVVPAKDDSIHLGKGKARCRVTSGSGGLEATKREQQFEGGQQSQLRIKKREFLSLGTGSYKLIPHSLEKSDAKSYSFFLFYPIRYRSETNWRTQGRRKHMGTAHERSKTERRKKAE